MMRALAFTVLSVVASPAALALAPPDAQADGAQSLQVMPMAPAGSCSPEHAAMGHCAPATAVSPSNPPEARDPDCPPEHAAMGHCTAPTGVADPPPTKPPVAALNGPEHAADTVWGADAMAPARRAVYAEHGSMPGSKVMLDRLEFRARNGRDGYAWDGDAWYGGDYDKLWLKSQGEGSFDGSLGSAEIQALWSHALDPWFNLQTGIRYDIRPRPDRAHVTIGVQGLVPYLFDVDATAFLSDHGELTGRIEAEYDQRITNPLILQPRVEINLAAQDVPSLRIGAGVSSIEAGLRLRYEVVPEFAPYLGVEYERRLGNTARFSRAAGEDIGGWAYVVGLRAWF